LGRRKLYLRKCRRRKLSPKKRFKLSNGKWNAQYLVSQLLEKISKLEERCNNIEEQCKTEFERINEDHFRDMQNLEQQNNDLRKMFTDPKQNTHFMNDDRKNTDA